MWKMCDTYNDCDECCGPGPPLIFAIPPPPQPPFLGTYDTDVSGNDGAQRLDMNVWEAMMVLDASYQSGSPAKVTLVTIVSLTLLLVSALVTFYFVWRCKGRAKDFLSRRRFLSSTHQNQENTTGSIVEYEGHYTHLPFEDTSVKRRYNFEIFRPTSVHYPSGYPIATSPPVFDCSSPGPSPYRSYESVRDVGCVTQAIRNRPHLPMYLEHSIAEDEISLIDNGVMGLNHSEAGSNCPQDRDLIVSRHLNVKSKDVSLSWPLYPKLRKHHAGNLNNVARHIRSSLGYRSDHDINDTSKQSNIKHLGNLLGRSYPEYAESPYNHLPALPEVCKSKNEAFNYKLYTHSINKSTRLKCPTISHKALVSRIPREPAQKHLS